MRLNVNFLAKEGRSVEKGIDEKLLLFFLGSRLSLLLLKGDGVRRRRYGSEVPAPLILLEGSSAKDALDDGDEPGSQGPFGGGEALTKYPQKYFFSSSSRTSGRSRSFM